MRPPATSVSDKDLKAASEDVADAKKTPTKEVMPLEVHYRGSCLHNVEAQENDWFLVPGGITVDSGAGENVMPNN